MTRRASGSPGGPGERPRLTRSADEATAEIGARIELGIPIRDRGIADPGDLQEARSAFFTWHEGNRALLRSLFTTDEIADGYSRSRIVRLYEIPFLARVKEHRDEVADRIRRLEGAVEQLRFLERAEPAQPRPEHAIVKVERVLRRFHRVARQLRSRYDGRPTIDVNDEYDVQDLLSALLRLDFDDVRPEEWTPSYAGGSSRMDFLLRDEKVVIEVKKTRRNLADRAVGEELVIDVARYRGHPDAQALVCFVYDPDGRITNPIGLRNDLARLSSPELRVAVVIAPE